MKSYSRSLRLDGSLEPAITALPRGTVNSLMNNLLRLFFEDQEVQKKVAAIDGRLQIKIPRKRAKVSSIAKEGITVPVDKPVQTVDKPEAETYSLLDSLLPD